MKTVICKETYIYDMERIIRKNCLKYNGLNTDADEFTPKTQTQTKQTIESTASKSVVNPKSIVKSNDDEWFDHLEMEFVQQNVWIFE